MPKNFVRRTYDAWIRHHHHRFRFAPWIAVSWKHCFTLRFAGLAPQLTFQVCRRGSAELFIQDEQGVYWDIIGDFDVMEKRRADGQYVCRWCEGGLAYPSRAALWEAHVFEPMLDWINALNANQRVCLYGIPEVTCWGARLVSEHDLEKHDCVDSFPLLAEEDDERPETT
ncbi:hypothetical protein [Thiocystis violacea]|uniref:hypothetical protein n=1 Tax=Thiocystis violacea TaxID=13725 RepID=UPI001905D169|nr:hypothetical protein [Thiocystis violacea]MBK1719704.1 hypothetical protein [Thiocystis violacea]